MRAASRIEMQPPMDCSLWNFMGSPATPSTLQQGQFGTGV